MVRCEGSVKRCIFRGFLAMFLGDFLLVFQEISCFFQHFSYYFFQSFLVISQEISFYFLGHFLLIFQSFLVIFQVISCLFFQRFFLLFFQEISCYSFLSFPVIFCSLNLFFIVRVKRPIAQLVAWLWFFPHRFQPSVVSLIPPYAEKLFGTSLSKVS